MRAQSLKKHGRFDAVAIDEGFDPSKDISFHRVYPLISLSDHRR
jgi:hypothetical protein